MTKILVVDDEPQLLRALRINLLARHYEVEVARDGGTALRQAAGWHPDLVVLDLGLPDIDGVDVIHGLRGWTKVPIIVLSGRSGSADKVDALDAGADDYVTKPFGIDELLARIRAVTRRAATQEEELAEIPVGDHVVDLVAKTVSGGVRLTPTEWHLLTILLRNPGKLISQRRLLTEVWGSNYVKETHYLRQYMVQLRRKLEADPAHPCHLLTEPGMGYRFQP
ncbi:DNA-binding response regulator [Sphaerisporangium krabiense]|uniref:Two-component system KDP operon response regulator KdpE n=1 Tax=Sphaerisporangium krabiense TaxID=763782 RepID=A0A7W8YZ54_9ACTN|nr:response regulator [Sphaerisporangium krabiense]MBB5624484.1 two-component system KDP operon response regulator KdpE [Sphaerisporangium krabiense]GII61560.1 DNA-binding response regulator [Sphaerisporangium krabiense]